MAHLKITLGQTEILELLSKKSGEAFKEILQTSLNKILQAESAEQLGAAQGSSADSLGNVACGGFFGHLKTELFYMRNWDNISIGNFIHEIG